MPTVILQANEVGKTLLINYTMKWRTLRASAINYELLVPIAVTTLIRLSSYTTWSTSETVVSVQLPLNSMFICHTEVLSHVVL